MSFSKEMNKFIAKNVDNLKWVAILIMVIWFVSGLVLVDVLDPYLFIGLWLPVGSIAAFFCYKW
jgi:hypothetical protein